MSKVSVQSRDVQASWLQVNSSKVARAKPPAEPSDNVESTLRPAQQGLGTFRSGSLPNVAAPQATPIELETIKVPLFWNLSIIKSPSSINLPVYDLAGSKTLGNSIAILFPCSNQEFTF